MATKKLLIVESPAKAGTIKKYLGKDYTVVASMGHVIDLPKSQLAVDTENHFKPRYITIRGKGPLLASLKKEAAKDLELRLQKKLRDLHLSSEETDTLRNDIGAAAEKSVNKLLFGLKDRVSQHTFRECLEGMEKVYEE